MTRPNTSGELPPDVRARVIALAEETLVAMAEADVPASLRAVRRFTPAKRARLGGASIGAALSHDAGFRAAVAAKVREHLPDLAVAADAGIAAPAVPAADLAAVAYLLDAPGWQARADEAASASPAEVFGAADDDVTARLRADLERSRKEARGELARLREDLATRRRESDELRRRLSRAESAARRSADAQATAEQQLVQSEAERLAQERELSAQIRRLRGRLRDSEESAAATKRGSRSEREAETSRLRVLLETLTGAAAGLRRELDLPVGAARPADAIAGAADKAAGPGLLVTLRRGRSADDPALVDDILAVPGMHLVIDGYNVTKLGYPSLTLEDQRGRLTSGLAALVARSPAAEVTCVFDATAATSRPVAAGIPRGLRVLFSAAGELADQLIVRLVAAEPTGRPVVVVTNDREVVEAVRRAGGDALASAALLGRLDRS